ncbi:cytochrome P450 2B4-like, partial [Clarias magur]
MQYGDLCCVYVGKRPMIVLNNVEMAKEALVQNGTVFSGRPHVPLIEWVTKGYGIVAVTYGHAWKQQRRFALHTLRNFGLGKKSVEERVAEEARCLITEMLKHEGKALDPMYPIMNAVSNIICSIIFGDRFDNEDKRFAKLLEILNENIRLSGSAVGLVFNLVPFIRHFPGPQQKILQNANALTGFIREVMEDHKKTLDSENLRDFIDAYLVEISKTVQYGDLCCVYVGRRPLIILNNIKMVKEAFVQNGIVFSGRPYIPVIDWVTNGYGILAVTYGHAWKQQRRFALHTLRNFGLGKKSVEERVAEEARCLITEMLKHE